MFGINHIRSQHIIHVQIIAETSVHQTVSSHILKREVDAVLGMAVSVDVIAELGVLDVVMGR